MKFCMKKNEILNTVWCVTSYINLKNVLKKKSCRMICGV